MGNARCSEGAVTSCRLRKAGASIVNDTGSERALRLPHSRAAASTYSPGFASVTSSSSGSCTVCVCPGAIVTVIAVRPLASLPGPPYTALRKLNTCPLGKAGPLTKYVGCQLTLAFGSGTSIG